MTSNPVTPDGKWMLTDLGWVCLEENQSMTPDGAWKFDKGTFTELRRIENSYEEGTVQVTDTLSSEDASKHPHLSIGDSVIMGDVKSDITVHQGPSLNKIKKVFRELLAEIGADTWNTPENISEHQKKLLSESIESYDGIISTGGITDSSTELMVATAAKLSGDFKDAIRRLTELIRKHPASTEANDAIQVLTQILIRLQDWEKAEAWTKKALVRFEEQGHWAGMGNTLMHRGRIFVTKRNTQEAINMFDEAHAIGLRERMPLLQVRSLTNKGIFLNSIGRVGEAKKILRMSLQLARSVGDIRSVSKISNELSYILESEGDIQGSSQLIRESRSELRNTDDKFIMAKYEFNEGTLLKRRNNLQMAKAKYLKAQKMFGAMGAEGKQGEVCISLSELEEDVGDLHAAILWMSKAMDCFSNPSHSADRLYCLSQIAGLHVESKNYAEAKKFSKLAIEMATVMNDPDVKFDSLINLGISLANKGDAAGARSRFTEAKDLSVMHIHLDDTKIPSY
jgi:tetratricopeptide (TPR) repeat protein